MVTTPKRQECNHCWAFAAAGQIESALLMAGWSKSDLDLSEQHVVSCSGAGTCDGGYRWDALQWATGTAVATEVQYPYQGAQVAPACSASIVGTAKLLAWGWVHQSGDAPDDPATLKDALCEYGPISIGILFSEALQHYPGGDAVFNADVTDGPGHAILLIGWDDTKGAKGAWLIKNSWDTDWGDGGYAWIQYGVSKVGRWATWAKAPAKGLVQSPVVGLDETTPQAQLMGCPEIFAEIQANALKISDFSSDQEGLKAFHKDRGRHFMPHWLSSDWREAADRQVQALLVRHQYLIALAKQKRCGSRSSAE
jgi:hypothetical protein